MNVSSAPRNGRATLLIFWDYDTQWGGDRSRSAGGPKTWGELEFPHTDRLLELHAEFSVPACFAVVGAAALPGEHPYHDPAQIRRIHEAGHEVGSHSHRHEWLPGLNGVELRETLRSSKESLEQCIGAPVTAFVPPWNQPFDFSRRLSFSLTERRHGGAERTNVQRLCASLREIGYRFCRIAYRPIHERLKDRFFGRLDPPRRKESIEGITCVRVNGFGFRKAALDLVERCVESGGIAVTYGHPHSLKSGGAQDERYLVPFLQAVRDYQRQGRLDVVLPRDLDGAS